MSHPIHGIPSELLAEIICLSTPLRYEGVQERRSILAPSHVCGLWRSVSLSTPALWTFVSFHCYQDDSISREMECAHAWLLRSGTRPLSIVISSVSSATLESIIKLLLPECTRWREIAMRYLDNHCSIFSQTTDSLPWLESIELAGVESLSCLSHFMVSPRLQRLTLTIHPSFQPSISPFPWNQLKYFNITTALIPALYDILSLSTSVSFFQAMIFPTFLSVEQIKTITNSSISTMHLLQSSAYGQDDPTALFLEHLVLPALRHLKITAPWIAVIPFISRSACRLLSLQIIMLPAVAFTELIELQPTLQDLTIRLLSIRDWETIMDVLTLTEHGPRRAPNLYSLDVRYYYITHTSLDMDCLANMIASRWGTKDGALRSPLKHVKIILNLKVDELMPSLAIIRLQNFVKEGLDMKINDVHSRDLLAGIADR